MKTHIELTEFVAALDKTLDPNKMQDYCPNGLQVARRDGKITKVCLGVDASLPLYEEALRRGAQLVICHHGLSWGDSLARVTGYNFDQLEFLLQNKLALYASHLPLDAHSKLGNNAQIAKALKLKNVAPFVKYHGNDIGTRGELEKPVSLDAFAALVKKIMGRGDVTIFPFGKPRVKTVAIASGGAPNEMNQAIDADIDVYLSGESNLSAYNRAAQCKINAVFAGHYATEVFGVRALAEHITKTFGIEAEFVDFKIPF
jgi:dinuclear metal center YbgI/SA1388 family protein